MAQPAPRLPLVASSTADNLSASPAPAASARKAGGRTVQVGGNAVVMMAGPCAAESREQVLESAQAVREAGATVLRAGAYKPRSSPYSFQGHGEIALQWMAEARERTGLPIVTEVMDTVQVEMVCQYADVLQIGARNMQNFSLLNKVGESQHTILLKRGMSSTVEDLLMSAEYVLSHGNNRVMLCERGIRTFEKATRNTFDVNAIPVLKALTHLPVIADPSHGTGYMSRIHGASSKGAVLSRRWPSSQPTPAGYINIVHFHDAEVVEIESTEAGG